MLDAFETDRQSPSSYWRHVRDSRRASPWKRSHPGGGLYSNREGESRPRQEERHRLVTNMYLPWLDPDVSSAYPAPVKTGLPAATNTSAAN
ncbi:hypothetical protein EAG_13792 [Camponotus floridanus]|uniref:Uncharacterized protein n=1 Tax=Camponotus floridanus TaxID=104421 RepID=E2AGC2_CAMFO|nr:hypothetical protein EAG_13792 [Camponotus floridanus]